MPFALFPLGRLSLLATLLGSLPVGLDLHICITLLADLFCKLCSVHIAQPIRVDTHCMYMIPLLSD